MENHIAYEIDILIKYIESFNGTPQWPGSFLAPSVLNVLWTLTAGRRIERDDKRLIRLLDLINRRSKVFNISGGTLAQYPWLRYIVPEKTGYNLICQLNNELHNFFMEAIEEHRQTLNNDNAESDLIYAYLKEMQERNEENSSFNEIQLTMTILDFFIAGSQTTSNTMDLALMMMSLRPDIQDKLQQEVDQVLKVNDKCPHLSERTCYPYVDAFIMEVQRFFNIVPITGPRRALWDTNLGGYNIPKNTTILIGLRSVHMDYNHWGDPECFRPERFIDEEGKTIKDEFFMPFGQVSY